MRVQTLGFLNAPVEGVRGLTVTTQGTMLEALPTVSVVATVLFFHGEQLKPGEETQVSVPVPNMPLNVDVKLVSATIQIEEDTEAGPHALGQKATVTDGGNARTFDVAVETPPLPRNVSVRLDGGETFWSFAATPVQGVYDLPDFARQANEYLDRLEAKGGEVALKFLVKADGPGLVAVRIEKLEYAVIQTQSWSNPLDHTERLDRTFKLDFGSIERVPLDPLRSTGRQSVSLARIALRLGGEFEPERLLTSVEAHAGREFASISSSYSLAQSLSLSQRVLGSEKPIKCVGVAGHFIAAAGDAPPDAQGAEIYVELQTDAGGAPSAGAPLSKSNLTVPLPEGAGEDDAFARREYEQLVFAKFESPVELKLDTPYWIVVKAVQGKVLLGLQARAEQNQQNDYLQKVLFNRGGQLWKEFGRMNAPRLAALLRLIYLPEIDNQMAAIEIGIDGTSLAQRSDPGADAQGISFDTHTIGQAAQVSLVIKSHARGTLSIANVIQEYAPAGATPVFQVARLTQAVSS